MVDGREPLQEKKTAHRVREKAASKLSAARGTMKSHGRDIYYGLHAVADLSLAVSGHATGTWGRESTGLLGVARNATWFPLRKYFMRSRADIVASFTAAASNIPQLMTSATAPETLASSLVISAYSLRGTARICRDRLENQDASPKSLKGLLKRAFDESKSGILIKIPPVMLGARAVMQFADGYMRHDFGAMAAGTLFMTAAVSLHHFDSRNSGKSLKP